MTDTAEAPAGPDIVGRLLNHAKELAIEYTREELPEIGDMEEAATTIESLRDANASLIAENNTLRAELAALRPDGRAR